MRLEVFVLLRKWTLWLVPIILLALGVIFFLGPRVVIDESISGHDLPLDLDVYLRQSESRFGDIRPGTEKQIVWIDPVRRNQTPYSIIYLHGFSATRQEIYPLCNQLAKALGANLFYTRLTGHGRSPQAMESATVNDWLNDTWESWKIGQRIGERVIVIGTSTGATLAAWLATQNESQNILALVLLSPNLGLQDKRSEWLLWPWAQVLAPWLVGQEYSWEPVNSEHRRYWTIRYPTRSLIPMMGIVQLMRQTDSARIKVPTFIAYSQQDKIIITPKVEAFYRHLGSQSKRLLVLEAVQDPQGHVLAGDILSPTTTKMLTQQILSFIRSLPGQ